MRKGAACRCGVRVLGMTASSIIACALLYIIVAGGIVAAFFRVGGDAQARDDASRERADADRAVSLAEMPAPETRPFHSEGNSL